MLLHHQDSLNKVLEGAPSKQQFLFLEKKHLFNVMESPNYIRLYTLLKGRKKLPILSLMSLAMSKELVKESTCI